MRRLLALLTVLMLPVLLVAEDKPTAKLNTLTEKEAQNGWLLLFDGETTMGWKIDGEAKVEKGVLILGGTKKTTAEVSTAFSGYSISLESTWEGKAKPTVKTATVRGNFKGSGKEKFSKVSGNFFATGVKPHSPVRVEVPAGTRVLLRNVKLKPIATSSLFNGKDLTGWKVHPGKKSKFTISKEGWLNLKDGPGDLQTEQLFDDFILQLECKSNGKYLNSGIFFRCIPEQYQQGYEAQIQNNFTQDPPRKYTVEVYDPKTHKLIDKKTVESATKDFGTGAIYRRVPARKGVAKDGEWFTMTVVAHGRHIATWVNGIQQVDWTDNRPANENGRNGYRAEAGAISIQGHDPTTDLSFRNIRITTLPRPKPKQTK